MAHGSEPRPPASLTAIAMAEPLAPAIGASSADTIPRLVASMYCEWMEFSGQ